MGFDGVSAAKQAKRLKELAEELASIHPSPIEALDIEEPPDNSTGTVLPRCPKEARPASCVSFVRASRILQPPLPKQHPELSVPCESSSDDNSSATSSRCSARLSLTSSPRSDVNLDEFDPSRSFSNVVHLMRRLDPKAGESFMTDVRQTMHEQLRSHADEVKGLTVRECEQEKLDRDVQDSFQVQQGLQNVEVEQLTKLSAFRTKLFDASVEAQARAGKRRHMSNRFGFSGVKVRRPRRIANGGENQVQPREPKPSKNIAKVNVLLNAISLQQHEIASLQVTAETLAKQIAVHEKALSSDASVAINAKAVTLPQIKGSVAPENDFPHKVMGTNNGLSCKQLEEDIEAYKLIVRTLKDTMQCNFGSSSSDNSREKIKQPRDDIQGWNRNKSSLTSSNKETCKFSKNDLQLKAARTEKEVDASRAVLNLIVDERSRFYDSVEQVRQASGNTLRTASDDLSCGSTSMLPKRLHVDKAPQVTAARRSSAAVAALVMAKKNSREKQEDSFAKVANRLSSLGLDVPQSLEEGQTIQQRLHTERLDAETVLRKLNDQIAGVHPDEARGTDTGEVPALHHRSEVTEPPIASSALSTSVASPTGRRFPASPQRRFSIGDGHDGDSFQLESSDDGIRQQQAGDVMAGAWTQYGSDLTCQHWKNDQNTNELVDCVGADAAAVAKAAAETQRAHRSKASLIAPGSTLEKLLLLQKENLALKSEADAYAQMRYSVRAHGRLRTNELHMLETLAKKQKEMPPEMAATLQKLSVTKKQMKKVQRLLQDRRAKWTSKAVKTGMRTRIDPSMLRSEIHKMMPFCSQMGVLDDVRAENLCIHLLLEHLTPGTRENNSLANTSVDKIKEFVCTHSPEEWHCIGKFLHSVRDEWSQLQNVTLELSDASPGQRGARGRLRTPHSYRFEQPLKSLRAQQHNCTNPCRSMCGLEDSKTSAAERKALAPSAAFGVLAARLRATRTRAAGAMPRPSSSCGADLLVVGGTAKTRGAPP